MASEALRAACHAEHLALAEEAAKRFESPGVRVSAQQWEPGMPVPEDAKLIHWVRHGQGYHNLLAEVSRQLGASFTDSGDYEKVHKDTFNPYLQEAIQDPPLTCLGIADAKALWPLAKLLNPELLVVSPLKRATQTILIGFREAIARGTAVIAHGGCREQCGVNVCDRRSSRSEYAETFPGVDTSCIKHEEDPTSSKRRETYYEMAHRAHDFMLWLRARPEKEIVVGTHSAFLMAVFNVALEIGEDSMKSFFKTGEMRSVLLRFTDTGGSRSRVGASRCIRNAACPSIQLANGVQVPMIGYGTAYFQDGIRRPELTCHTLRTALRLGYRHVDSAVMYGNERQVGGVLADFFAQGKLARESVFLTTKVAHMPTADYPNAKTQYMYNPELNAYQGVLQEFHQSLYDLGVGFVDLLLIHWPGLAAFPKDRVPKDEVLPTLSRELMRAKRKDMWWALESIYERKLARAIGVSNFTKEHLADLLPCKVMPMMNQIEVHPYLAQAELVEYCQGHGIQVTAYSPLAAGHLNLMQDPVILQIATEKNIGPGQVVLSWLLQRDIIVIPKSANEKRMLENLSVSKGTLSAEDMAKVSALDRGMHTCPDPKTIA